MISRYIYAVTKELPKKLEKEIGSELRALIDDMIDGMDNDISEEEKIHSVLLELGNPKELANRYSGRERYLIGPKYFDKYIFVMKIVVYSIFIGISVASALGVMFSATSTTEVIFGYIGTLFSAVLQGAAWVTGVFALLEYKEISVETGMEQETWAPSQLPELPDKNALISRGESVFAIMMSTIFLTLLFFVPEVVGVYYRVNGESNLIPFFNIVELAPLKIIIFLIFTLNISIELIKIIKGRWTMKIAIITTVLNIISAALFVNVIYNTNIWNSEMVQIFEQYMPISFERMILFIIVVIIISTIGEAVSALYKGLKYGGIK